MERHEESLTGNGGVKISYDTWTPAPEPALPRGILVISHGLGEHGQRYDHVAERLGGLGLNVGVSGHPGPGPSGGPPPGVTGAGRENGRPGQDLPHVRRR